MIALWKASGGSLNKEENFNKEVDFRYWHCGRQGWVKFK